MITQILTLENYLNVAHIWVKENGIEGFNNVGVPADITEIDDESVTGGQSLVSRGNRRLISGRKAS